MSERPSEMDLVLDAIDQAFKDVVAQLTKNAEDGATREAAREAFARIRRARVLMIEWTKDSV